MSLTQSMIFPSNRSNLSASDSSVITEDTRKTIVRNLIEILSIDGAGLKSGVYDLVLFKIIRRLAAFSRCTTNPKQREKISKLLKAIKALHRNRMRVSVKQFEVDLESNHDLREKFSKSIITTLPVFDTDII